MLVTHFNPCSMKVQTSQNVQAVEVPLHTHLLVECIGGAFVIAKKGNKLRLLYRG